MSNIYRDFILDHYKNPRNFGKITKADFSEKRKNIFCGDVIEISGKLEKNKIKDVKFVGRGCAISQASASILTEYAKGKSLKQIKDITIHDLSDMMGVELSPTRMKCAELSLKTLNKALGVGIIKGRK